jgi:hypothetical protein
MEMKNKKEKRGDAVSCPQAPVILLCYNMHQVICRGLRDCGRMVVWFTTTNAISAYHHWCCEFESRLGWGVKHYVIKFVSDLRQAGGFLRVLPVSPINKSDRHDITEMLLKVLNTIKL